MKILHCSDIHLGRKVLGAVGEYSKKRFDDYFNAFDWAVETAINEKVEVMIIAGDFFDKRELLPEILSRAEVMLNKLKSANIQVILIEGNHDNVSRGYELDSWLLYLEQKGLIIRPYYEYSEDYIFNKITIKDVNFYGLGYPGSLVNEVLIKLSEHLDNFKDEKNIVLVHTAIGYDEKFPGTAKKESIDILKDKVIYIAAGHFHNYAAIPANEPYFFIPGSLEYWDIDEITHKKGVILFDTDTKKHTFVESKRRSTFDLKLEYSGTDMSELEVEIIKKLDKIQIIPNESVVKLNLKLSNDFNYDLEKCEEIINSRNPLKAFIKIDLENSIQRSDYNNPLIGREQIEFEEISNWQYFSINPELTHHSLKQLIEFQESKNEKNFVDTFDNLLNQILERKENEN